MEGKPNEFVLKPLNFADDIVRGSDCIFKNGLDTLFVDVDYGHHFWLNSNFNR